MKRRLVVLLLLLVGGAIVNVAVAWGCAIWDTPLIGRWEPEVEEVAWLGRYAPNHPEIGIGHGFRSVGNRWIATEWYDPTARAFLHVGLLETGWPTFSINGLWVIADDDSFERHWIIFVNDEPGIPLRPIWPAFAINTVFYAVGLWLLFAGPFVVRRWRRIRRGLCPKCAYDLRGTPGATSCPECGNKVDRTHVRPAL